MLFDNEIASDYILYQNRIAHQKGRKEKKQSIVSVPFAVARIQELRPSIMIMKDWMYWTV